MKTDTFRTLIGALALVLGSTMAWAQSNNQISVKCVDSAGNAVSKAEVQIMEVRSGNIKDEETNRQGVAEFKKLRDGVYRVWARKEGYAPAFHEFIIAENGASEQVTLQLEPGDPEKVLYFEDNAVATQAVQLLQESASLLQQQKFDEAEAKLQESLAINPSEPNAYFNLALVHINRGNWDKVEKNLKKAQELLLVYQKANPGNPALQQQLDAVQRELDLIPLRRLAGEIEAAMDSKDFETALAKLDEMVKLQPTNPSVYYNQALALIQMNRLPEASEKLDKAIELAPDEQALKDLKNRIGEVVKAQEAAALKAKVATVQTLYQEKKYEEAIAKAKEAMEVVPDDLKTVLWAQMANAYLALEKYEEAVEAYHKHLDLSGKPVAEGLFELAQQLSRKGKQSEAAAIYQRILEVNPDFPEVYYELGMYAFYEQQDKAKAKKLLQKYLEIGTDENKKNNAQNVLVVIEKT